MFVLLRGRKREKHKKKKESTKTDAETGVMSPAVQGCRSHWKLEEA